MFDKLKLRVNSFVHCFDFRYHEKNITKLQKDEGFVKQLVKEFPMASTQLSRENFTMYYYTDQLTKTFDYLKNQYNDTVFLNIFFAFINNFILRFINESERTQFLETVLMNYYQLSDNLKANNIKINKNNNTTEKALKDKKEENYIGWFNEVF